MIKKYNIILRVVDLAGVVGVIGVVVGFVGGFVVGLVGGFVVEGVAVVRAKRKV